MSASFTPGPWDAEPMVPQAKHGFYIVATPDGNNSACNVATVGPSLNPKAEANARLIAAAPELYEAVIALLDGSTREDRDAAWAKGTAALAKARGATVSA